MVTISILIGLENRLSAAAMASAKAYNEKENRAPGRSSEDLTTDMFLAHISELERALTKDEQDIVLKIAQNGREKLSSRKKADTLLKQNKEIKKGLSESAQSKDAPLYAKELAEFKRKADYTKYGHISGNPKSLNAAKKRAGLEVLGITDAEGNYIGKYHAMDIDTIKEAYYDRGNIWNLRSAEHNNQATAKNIEEIRALIDQSFHLFF